MSTAGHFVVQVQGKRKWTTLKPSRCMYYGRGYELTEAEAYANALQELADAQARFPDRGVVIVGARRAPVTP